MSWKRGDLGRFLAENRKRPRFELIGPTADRTAIEVWYGGSTKKDTISKESLKYDCTNVWELQEVVPPRPKWLQEGATFDFPSAVSVRQVEILDPKYHHLTNAMSVDLGGRKVRIRRIRRDYASCLVDQLLVLVPLVTIVKFGIQRVSRWDRIMSDQDPYEDVEGDPSLFKDFY